MQISQWRAFPWQDDLSKNPATTRCIIGANRTGKTEWGAREVYYFVTGTHPYREIIPPVEAWIGTPSFDTQVESAQPKLLKFLKDKDISRVEYLRGQIMQRLYLKDGSVIAFKSYEQGRDKFQGAAKRIIWFDEEPPHDIWTEAVVRHEAGIPLDIILTMTPINGMTWVYDEIFQQAEAKNIPIKTPSWDDNPTLTSEQKGQMASLLTQEELEVRKFGRFVRRVGLVCHWWRRDIHVVDMSTFDAQGKTIWVGIDFGFTNSFTAALMIAIDRDDLYIFDGIYEKGLTTDILAQRLKQKLAKIYVSGWRGDSAQAEDIAELRKYGIPIEGVKKETGSTKENWDEYRARLMTQYGSLNPQTGKPRIYIASHLTCEIDGRMVNWFAHEAENLRWKQTRTADGMKARSEWGDDQKDAIDAFSYVLTSLPIKIETKFVDRTKLIEQIPKEKLFNEHGFY